MTTRLLLVSQLVDKAEISRARPTWGLDEALATVPGGYAANRYNFSLNASPIRVGGNFVPGRYYEPAPGRNMYVGFSFGAGE